MMGLGSSRAHRRPFWGPVRRGILALTLAIPATGCQEEPVAPAPTHSTDPQPLVKVNGKVLTSRDFDAFLQLSQAEPEEIDRDQVLEELVTREVVYQAAQSEGFRVGAEEIDLALEQWFGAGGYSDEQLRHQVEAFLTVQKFLQERISADTDVSLLDLQRYYETRFEEFEVDDQLRVLEILVDERSQAEQLRSQLQAGDFRGFREAARAHSKGLTAAQGGELGVFQPGDLPQRFEDAIFSLKVGDISEVFQSEHGFHLFLVEERTPRHEQKFYEVKDEIFRRLVAEREREQLDQLLSRLRQGAAVEVVRAPGREMEKES